jgi:DNA-binding CsgD family transcriptional regulator
MSAERSDVPALPQLTRRELEILRLVAQGHANGEVAKMLWVTEQTVKFHLSNTYRKLGVANRTEASHWAYVQGVLDGAVTLHAVDGRSPAGPAQTLPTNHSSLSTRTGDAASDQPFG